jgi:peptidoglycan/LPS O-acetylase OafA/YrhL
MRWSLCAMTMLGVVSAWIARFRAQRWSKEILLAIVLTLAAAVFIATALMGQEAHVEAKPPSAAASK